MIKPARYLIWFSAVVIIVAEVFSHLAATSVQVWDDALMFARYADNFVASGGLVWNLEEVPTYGMTSVLYVGVQICVEVILKATNLVPAPSPSQVAFLSSALSGVVFLIFVAALIERSVTGSPAPKFVCACITLIGVYGGRTQLATHFESGMDTTFVMAYLAAYLLMAHYFFRKKTFGAAAVMAITGALAFFARPDLLLYTLSVPAVMALQPLEQPDRNKGVFVVATTLAVSLLTLLVAKLYFGSALPLSFYAKSLGLYSSDIWKVYATVGPDQLIVFLKTYWFLVVIVLLSFPVAPEFWRSPSSSIEKGLLLATAAFWIYYSAFVLQIMPYEARFYYPTFPALLYLAARSAAEITARLEHRAASFDKVTRYAFPIVALSVFVFSAAGLSKATQKLAASNAWVVFDQQIEYKARFTRYWMFLDKFSALPDDLVVAATEIGRLSAMNPKKKIIDLSGLNNTYIAHNGFSGEWFFSNYQPDLIYLPHPHYKGLIKEITACPKFPDNYVFYSTESRGGVLDLAIKRTSPHFAEMMAIVKK